MKQFNMGLIKNLLYTTDKKVKKITSKIIEGHKYKLRTDIAKFNSALYNAKNGNAVELMKFYNMATKDSHVKDVMSLRTERLLGTKFKITDSNGKESSYSNIFNSKWFYDFLNLASKEVYYGFSLIQIDGIVNSNISKISQVPFKNVIIGKQLLIKDTLRTINKDNVISYGTRPYLKWLFEIVNDRKNLGLLEGIIPLIIWKNSTMQAWAEYSEIFGMPIRIGKTSSNIEEDRLRMAKFLKNLAKSAYAVIDEEDTIEFVETSKSDSFNVYDKFIERINSEISKLVVGATMITDSGASYSQSEVHNTQLNLKVKSDLRNIEFIINDNIIPHLQLLDILPNGIVFKFDDFEQLSLTEQINIDKELNNIYSLDKEFLTNKYRVKFSDVIIKESK